MVKLVVANPNARIDVTRIQPAPRPTTLDGATVGLYWNIKAGGDIALDRVEELLAGRLSDARFVRYVGSIGSTVRHLTPADADEIHANCDVVIGTTGD
jgi:hypothetical protein